MGVVVIWVFLCQVVVRVRLIEGFTTVYPVPLPLDHGSVSAQCAPYVATLEIVPFSFPNLFEKMNDLTDWVQGVFPQRDAAA